MAIPTQLVTQTKTLQLQLSRATRLGVSKVVPDLSKLSRQEAGGALRTIATGSLAQFGNVATQSARVSYDAMRAASLPSGSKFAASALELDVAPLSDVAVGTAMSIFSEERYGMAAAVFVDVVDKMVGDVFRETIAGASYDDKDAIGYQRVASPDACAFCAMVCLNEYTSFEEDGGYHDNCGCTTIPIFNGLGSFRPSYYDEFQSELEAARANIVDLKEMLYPKWEAQWKADGGRMGKNLNRDFLKANPQASINTKNLVAQIRSATDRR